MFDGFFHVAFIGPGGPEILVIMLVLLMLFGSKDAPRIFRKINDFLTQLRNTANQFKHEVMYGDMNADSRAKDAVYEVYEESREPEEPIDDASSDVQDAPVEGTPLDDDGDSDAKRV